MNLVEPFVEPGAVVGPYEMIEELGTGGSGQVLKARDIRTGELRAVKIKFLRRRRERQPILNLRRELRAIARCDHPNIARAYDIGVTERYAYLVMEYVPGIPLDAFLYRTGLEPGLRRDRLVAFLGMQIAGALEHIHSRHLIHRDLKPPNILVTDSEVVKIIDFGIARDVVRGETVEPGDLAGTYAYCSPEQVSEVPLDHRSDLYSLGVVLYEMLTDHLPFAAESPFTFVVKHITAPPAPLETYYPEVSASFRDLILRLLAKKPRDRPQTALEVERFLKSFVEAFDTDRRGPRVALYGARPTQARMVLEPEFVDRKLEFLQLEGAISLLEAGAGGAMLLTGESGVGKSRLLDEALASARGRGVSVFSARCLPQSDRPFQCLLDLVAAMAESIEDTSGTLIQTMLGDHLAVLAREVPQVARLLPDGGASQPGREEDTSELSGTSTPRTVERGWREVVGEQDIQALADEDEALEELTEESVQILETDLLEDRLFLDRWSSSAATSTVEIAEAIPALPGETQAAATDEEEQLRSAVHAFLTLVPDRPTVLAVKDLQWSDASLISLLSDLVGAPESPLASPVIWIGTVSTDELDGEQPIEPWLANPPSLVDILPIGPLSRAHVLAMVESMLQPSSGLEELVGRLYDLSKGNPLFVYELVHELVESGGLVFESGEDEVGAWRSSSDDVAALSALQAGSLEEMMADRLDQLDPDAARIVEWLAVLGRPCPFEWVGSVSGFPEDKLLEHVETLVSRHIVSERVGRRRTTLALYYPRFAGAIRRRIDPERLDGMRIRAAEAWLDLMGPDAVTELVADLLYRAGDYSRAVDYLLEGATRASRLGLHYLAYRRAAQAVHSCIEVPDIDERRTVRAELSAGLALEKVDKLEPSLPYLNDAYLRAEQAGFQVLSGLALAAMGQVYVRSGELGRALGFLDAGVERLARTGPLEHLPPMLESKGRVHIALGNIDAAVLCFDRLVMFEEVGRSAERRARAHRGLAAVALFEGRLETARHWLDSAGRFADTWGDRTYAELCRLDTAYVRFLRGDMAGARVEMERARENLERSGAIEGTMEGLARLIQVVLDCNDTALARRLLDRLSSLVDTHPNQLFDLQRYYLRGRADMAEGRWDSAATAARQARDGAAEQGFVALQVFAGGLFGIVEVRKGNVDAGLESLEAAVESGERAGCVLATLRARLWHAEGIEAAGDQRKAAECLDAIRQEAARVGLAPLQLRACTRRLAIAETQGEDALARKLRTNARDLYQELVRGMTREEQERFTQCPDLEVLVEAWEPGRAPGN